MPINKKQSIRVTLLEVLIAAKHMACYRMWLILTRLLYQALGSIARRTICKL